MSAAYILAKLIDFRKVCLPHLDSNLFGGHPGVFGPYIEEAIDEDCNAIGRRRRHIDPELETSPHGAVEQLGMIGRCDNDNIARQLIELHEQERDNALDLARLMNVSAFLPDGVELVEKEDARHRPRIFE